MRNKRSSPFSIDHCPLIGLQHSADTTAQLTDPEELDAPRHPLRRRDRPFRLPRRRPSPSRPRRGQAGRRHRRAGREGFTPRRAHRGRPRGGGHGFNGKDKAASGRAGTRCAEQGSENKAGAGTRSRRAASSTRPQGRRAPVHGKEYADFVVPVRVQADAEREQRDRDPRPADGRLGLRGMEVQVLDDSATSTEPQARPSTTAACTSILPAKRGAQKPVGEWNSQEIRVEGTKVKVTLNDQVIVDADLADVTDEALLKKHPGAEEQTGPHRVPRARGRGGVPEHPGEGAVTGDAGRVPGIGNGDLTTTPPRGRPAFLCPVIVARLRQRPRGCERRFARQAGRLANRFSSPTATSGTGWPGAWSGW
jgi:hypothetical protein